MTPVRPPPAFGFQDKEHYPKGWYKQYGESLKEKNLCKNGDNVLPPKKCISAWNWNNAIGYIPLFGICSGIFHLALGFSFKSKELPNRYSYIARGVIECFCLGFLLIIPDLLATGYAHCFPED